MPSGMAKPPTNATQPSDTGDAAIAGMTANARPSTAQLVAIVTSSGSRGTSVDARSAPVSEPAPYPVMPAAIRSPGSPSWTPRMARPSVKANHTSPPTPDIATASRISGC